MGLWLDFGLQAGSTGLWLWILSKTCLRPDTVKKPVRKASLLPGSCQNAFPFSVPGGWGVVESSPPTLLDAF